MEEQKLLALALNPKTRVPFRVEGFSGGGSWLSVVLGFSFIILALKVVPK